MIIRAHSPNPRHPRPIFSAIENPLSVILDFSRSKMAYRYDFYSLGEHHTIMARFKRLTVLKTMLDTGLVPVFYNDDVEIAKNVAKAVYEGGARLLEFTNRGDHASRSSRSSIVTAARKSRVDPRRRVGVRPGHGRHVHQYRRQLRRRAAAQRDCARVCNRRKVPYSPAAAASPRSARPRSWAAKSSRFSRAPKSAGRRSSRPSWGRARGR